MHLGPESTHLSLEHLIKWVFPIRNPLRARKFASCSSSPGRGARLTQCPTQTRAFRHPAPAARRRRHAGALASCSAKQLQGWTQSMTVHIRCKAPSISLDPKGGAGRHRRRTAPHSAVPPLGHGSVFPLAKRSRLPGSARAITSHLTIRTHYPHPSHGTRAEGARGAPATTATFPCFLPPALCKCRHPCSEGHTLRASPPYIHWRGPAAHASLIPLCV